MPIATLVLSMLLAAPVLAAPPVPPAPPAPPAPGLFHFSAPDDDDEDEDEQRPAARTPWDHLTRDQVFELLKAREARHAVPMVLPSPGPVATVVPLGLFTGVVLIVGLLLFFRSRRERERYLTIRHLVEKGADLPPSLLDPPRAPHADLRRGLLLGAGATGLGLCLGMLPDVPHRVWTVALVPAGVAVAYLITFALARRMPAPAPEPTTALRTTRAHSSETLP